MEGTQETRLTDSLGTSELNSDGRRDEKRAESSDKGRPQGPSRGAGRKSAATGANGGAKQPNAAADIPARPPVAVTLQSLLEAGVHFGHQTSRWSPAMAPFIYTSRNGIHIINLPRTVQCWERARKVIVDTVAKGGNVLFVGTKKQAQDAVEEEARRCGAFYVSKRWLGGMITNFQTIRKSIDRLNKIESILAEQDQVIADGGHSKYTKKERLMMSKELEKLNYSLGGIRSMHEAPDLMFVIDIRREDIAVKEGRRLDIPVIALVDSNCDPRQVNYPIPSNDDGTRAIRLFCSAVADAVAEGKRVLAENPVQQTRAKFSVVTKPASDSGAQQEAFASQPEGTVAPAGNSTTE